MKTHSSLSSCSLSGLLDAVLIFSSLPRILRRRRELVFFYLSLASVRYQKSLVWSLLCKILSETMFRERKRNQHTSKRTTTRQTQSFRQPRPYLLFGDFFGRS